MIRHPLWTAAAVTTLLLAACGDDTPASTPDAGIRSDASRGDAAPPGDAGARDDAAISDDAGGPPREGLALVRGTLFTDDLDMASARHDTIASMGQVAAMAAGDFAHDPFLGTELLGTTPGAFLSIDRWNDPSAMASFYSDPTFAEAFATLFDGPPSVELFERREDFHGWGDLDSADASDPRFFVVVRGRLADTDLDSNRTAHDAVAAAGEESVRAAGDVAHAVYLRLDDPRELLAVDVWGDAANIEAVYSDPDFVAAFGALFEGSPSVAVYQSTDWVQW